MEIQIIIGNRIREVRKHRNISQEALANLADVDRTYMTGVETGRRNVTVKILSKIINALEISYKDFFDHESFNDHAKETVK
jgi:transcriptional regulator with XRE-family HTH domain